MNSTNLQSSNAISSKPLSVILDTDMGNDVDDALALAMLHELEVRGKSRLLAVTLSIKDPLAAPYIDALNRYFGRTDIPIGECLEGVFVRESKFLQLVNERTETGELVFPWEPRENLTAPELLRKTLAEADDQSVVIIQIGFSTNLAKLLDSGADQYSPLSGLELIKAKVKYVSLMAGAFQTIGTNNHYCEFNVKYDVPAAQKLVKEWPTPMIWSGFEVGEGAPFPAWSIDEDFALEERNLLRESYQHYEPTPHQRPTWDLTSVAYPIFPERGYFGLSEAGAVIVEDDGFTRFVAKPGGRDRFLTVNAIQGARLQELFAALASAVPRGPKESIGR